MFILITPAFCALALKQMPPPHSTGCIAAKGPVPKGRIMTYEFEPLINADEVAQLLGLHPKTVQQMARKGALPAIRVGKFWRFRKSEIDHSLRSGVDSARYACRQNEEVQS